MELASQRVRAEVGLWERWAGSGFPTSGSYAVEGALGLVQIDLAAGVGEYLDPCLWMRHPLETGDAGIELVGPDAIRGHLRQSLPEYMVPEQIRFVSAMPRSTAGKIDLAALKLLELAAAPRPRIVVAQNQLQETLRDVWRAVLRREDIGMTDDFFELGGHSVRALQILARVTQLLAIDVSLREFLDDATIAGLERCLRRRGAPDAPAS